MNRSAIVANVNGSNGSTLTRMLVIARVATTASTKPIASPMPLSRIPSPMTSEKMSLGSAPNATRTPISDVRAGADYRRAMLRVHARRALASAIDRRDGAGAR